MALLVLIGALVVVGAVLRLLHHDDPSMSTIEETTTTHDPEQLGEPEICCGLHEICSKSAQRAGDIVYFDDEELDRFAQRSETSSYTPNEIEEFRDVLMTLPPDEIVQWQESLAMRKIPVPDEIREEMIILLDEIALGAGNTSN